MPTESARYVTPINDLTFQGHVYKGKLPPPKGSHQRIGKDREQTLFQVTECWR